MIKNSCFMLISLFCIASCASLETTGEVAVTWAQAVKIARQKAKAGEYAYIMDNMLAQEFVDKMIGKYGTADWRKEFQEGELARLPFYFGWLEKCEVKTSGDKVFLRGQHGCYAVFLKVKGRYLILDFGQRITSM